MHLYRSSHALRVVFEKSSSATSPLLLALDVLFVISNSHSFVSTAFDMLESISQGSSNVHDSCTIYHYDIGVQRTITADDQTRSPDA